MSATAHDALVLALRCVRVGARVRNPTSAPARVRAGFRVRVGIKIRVRVRVACWLYRARVTILEP